MGPEKFLIKAATERMINNKTKKLAMLVKDRAKLDMCVDHCVTKWRQGNCKAEDAFRSMEDYAKSLTVKPT
jgi:hypothetical protein